MYSTYFNGGNVARSVVSTFGGINRRARIGDGECADMQNMSSDAYPLLSPRKARIVAQKQLTATKTETVKGDAGTEETVETTVHKNLNGILGDVGFCAVWGTDFYYLGKKIGGISLIDGEKRLVAFGANILIYPDQKYYNTATGDSGAMETVETVSGKCSASTEGFLYAEDARITGNAISVNYLRGNKGFACSEVSLAAPVFGEYIRGDRDRIRGTLLLRINGSKIEYASSGTIERYGNSSEIYLLTDIEWSVLPVSCVTVFGLPSDATGYLWSGDNPVEFSGNTVTLKQKGDLSYAFSAYEAEGKELSLNYSWTKSNLPRLDYVCALDNRLWGCRYGVQAGSNEDVNEIYCTKLGKYNDFTTGTTADAAWTASVGAYGKWTGCIALNGRVLFFKDDKIIRVSGTKPANFQYTEISDIGLQAGCERSMQIIDGVLYYKSRDGVYAYDGSLPTRISDSLGDAQNAKTAVAGSVGGKYYIALDGILYVYDTRTGLWHKEDRQNLRFFTRYNGSLYATIDNDIVCLAGEADAIFALAESEKDVEWSVESGDIGLDSPYQKYYRRLLIRASGETGAEMSVNIVSDGEEQTALDHVFDGMQTVVLPITTPRCDHMRVKISGRGAVKIYSVSYETETVGDMPERR